MKSQKLRKQIAIIIALVKTSVDLGSLRLFRHSKIPSDRTIRHPELGWISNS